jgi:uncharacterized membrane protein YhaH (DUF805 family)
MNRRLPFHCSVGVPVLSFTHALFGFDGRLARLPYFGNAVLLSLFFFVGVVTGAMISADTMQGGAVRGGLVLLGVFCTGFWAGLALIIKRLHDMGLAASVALVVAAPALAILLSIAAFGVALWLLLGAGQSHSHQYGPVPQPSRLIA